MSLVSRALLVLSCAGLLAGFTPRQSRIGGLWALTVPLGSVSMLATWLMFIHHTLVLGPGGIERVALWPLLGWAAATGVSVHRWRPVLA